MDPKLMNLIDNSLPAFNDLLIDGFHKHDLGDVVKHVDKKFSVILKPIESKGVYYKGLEVLSPHEIMNKMRDKSTYKDFETQKETLFPVRVKFGYDEYQNGNLVEFNDNVIKLPYVDRYGDLYIDSNQYSLQMVLSERCLSVTKENSLFLKLLGYKCKLSATNYSIDVVKCFGGHALKQREPIALPSNRFYKMKKRKGISTAKKPIPLLAWYNFANKGFYTCMKEDAECDIVISKLDTLISEYGDKEEWHIFSPTYIPGLTRLSNPIGLDVSVAIRPLGVDKTTVSVLAKQYVAALFLAVDVDELLYDEYMCDLNDINYWRLLIGKCSIWREETKQRYLKYMGDHFVAIEGYLDEISLKKLNDQYIPVNDIFELFSYILTYRSDLLYGSNRADAFNKTVESAEYALASLFEATTLFKQSVLNTTDLRPNKLKQFLNKYFRQNIIYDLKTGGNAAIKSTSTDNPLADYLLEIIPQSNVFSGKEKPKKQSSKANDSSTLAHPSIAFAFSYQRITKPYPDGRGYLNPCVMLLPGSNRISLRNDCKELYEETAKRLAKQE